MSLDTKDKDKDFGTVLPTDLSKVYSHLWCRLANNKSTFRIFFEDIGAVSVQLQL